VLVALLPLPLLAFVPAPEKLTNAAALANYNHGRTGGLRLEVALFTEFPTAEVEPIATGQLIADPARSAARLDLVGRNGVREQHLWTGSAVRTWRDGARLTDARALLPPLYLLQFRYGRSLRGALKSLGVDLERADLARSDVHDCFVVGGTTPRSCASTWFRGPASASVRSWTSATGGCPPGWRWSRKDASGSIWPSRAPPGPSSPPGTSALPLPEGNRYISARSACERSKRHVRVPASRFPSSPCSTKGAPS
jgi:hypothetical protein